MAIFIVRQNICLSELNDANRTMSWIKKCLIFPYYFKIDSETALQCNSIGTFISHSVIYILGGPIASFIPQVYDYVRKYVFLVHAPHVHSGCQYILWSISLPELLCSNNVATDGGGCKNVTICPTEIGCHTNALQYIHWKMPPKLTLPTVKYIIVHWYFFNIIIKLTRIT